MNETTLCAKIRICGITVKVHVIFILSKICMIYLPEPSFLKNKQTIK